MRAGDRVGVAVSGGADSVALLRILLELRAELGVVLAVVHFNHGIRGADADADQRFVAALAAAHGLEFHCASADTPAYARQHGLSLEAAGRELRYGFFEKLLAGTLDVVATAHTMDDQAETVLLRILRGAGTRGIAGIFPKLRGTRVPRVPAGDTPAPHPLIVRPLLQVRRGELREYLNNLGRPWREDASNLDVKHTRNRLRHELLPMVERNFNPAVVQVLAEMAEVARAEEEYWDACIRELLPTLSRGGSRSAGARSPKPGATLDRIRLLDQPLAVRRRLVRAFAEECGLRLDFHHVEDILEVAGSLHPLETKRVELPDGVLLCTARELWFEPGRPLEQGSSGYEYRLPVPGEVRIPEVGLLLKARVIPAAEPASGYNQNLLDSHRLAPELTVRNWRPGDRFRPAHSKSPRKLKELLLRRRIAAPQRALWPVVVSGERIVWVPGLGPAAELLAGAEARQRLVIEEVTADR
jgi:tRNA(Ile)-lysidine synthase